MKNHRLLWMASGGASAVAAGAPRARAELPGKSGASFVHHRRRPHFGPQFGRTSGAGAAPITISPLRATKSPLNTPALRAANDDAIDPFDLYDDPYQPTPAPPQSASWGVADDWSRLSSAASAASSFATAPDPAQASASGTYDVVDEAARLLEEQERMMHEWETEGGGAAATAASGASSFNAHHVRDPNDDDAFVEDAIEVIASHSDYDEGGARLYDTPSSLSSAGGGADKNAEDRNEEEELAFLVRCNQPPERFLVSQGRALPALTEGEKRAPAFLLEGRGSSDDDGDAHPLLPLRPAATAFLERAVGRIFDAHAVRGEGGASTAAALDREALAKWMTQCLSYSPPDASSDAAPVVFGPYDREISALLSRYSRGHGSGRLTRAEFQALYLEVAWAGYVNDVLQKRTGLDGKHPLPSADAGVLIEGKKNTEKMLKRATLSLVWRDLEAHEIFSPAEEERVRLLKEMERLQSQRATAGTGKHAPLLMDECELFDDYAERLSHRSFSEENDGDVLGEERAWDFLKRKEKGSHELVEMASDGETPLRVRDGKFVFVDEESCIGCTQCATIAPSSFKMIEETGRARTYHQSNAEDVEHAVMACPVNCMHFLSFDELKEMEVSRDDGDGRTDHRHFGGGRTHTPLHVAGRDSDANHKSSWYHYLKWKCHGSSACPQRGCYDCPTYAPGQNPYFIERHDRAEHIRAKDFLNSGEADKWRTVVEL